MKQLAHSTATLVVLIFVCLGAYALTSTWWSVASILAGQFVTGALVLVFLLALVEFDMAKLDAKFNKTRGGKIFKQALLSPSTLFITWLFSAEAYAGALFQYMLILTLIGFTLTAITPVKKAVS